jgi:glycosyltransferase involved in cell wall biosynthesis
MSDRLAVAMLSHLAKQDAPTGAERSLAQLASGLARRGHRVVVVAPGPWTLQGELSSHGVEVVVIPSRACWLTYWDHRPWPLVAGAWLRYASSAWASRRRLAAFLGSWRPNTIHVNCLPHLAGALAALETCRPRLWHLRELLPPGPRRRFWAERLRRFGGDLVAVSEAVASWVRDEGLGERVHVVHNGIAVPATPPGREAARHTLGLDEKATIVAYLGQLLPHKGVAGLLQALAAAAREAPSIALVLAGPGPVGVAEGIQEQASALGCASRVTVLQPQAQPELLLAASDLVAVPTLTPDPLPRAVLEAMAASRPVVASACGGIGEMVVPGVTGLLPPPGDPAALARALVTLSSDPELCTRMGAAGLERARSRFSMDTHLDRMEELLLGRRTGRRLPSSLGG